MGDFADLFARFDAVKDYYTMRLSGPTEDVVAPYKARIRDEFFPARGYGKARLAVARKAVTDYKRLSPSPASLGDLMLYYVETGVEFTNTYGDINETFYSSMESMYARAAELIAAHDDLRDLYGTRCRRIVDATRSIGWGFPDALSEIYDDHFRAGGPR